MRIGEGDTTLEDSLDPFGIRRRKRAARNMFPLVGGQAISLFGDYIAFFTLPYFVLSLTGSAVDLGLTAAASTLPILLFGLVAGVFLDRRRRLIGTLVGTDLVRSAAFLGLALAAFDGRATALLVFGVAFLVGSMAVVFDSGLQALMPSVLEDDMLIHANSRLALARMVTLAVGPLVGGVVIVLSDGFGIAFLINSFTFVVSALLLTMLRPIRRRLPSGTGSFRRSLGEGLSYLFGDARLRWATLGGTMTNLVFQPLEALLVLFVVTEVLDHDSSDVSNLAIVGVSVGIFYALNGAIGAVGIAVAPKLSRRIPLGTMYLIGLVMLGGGFLAVTVMRNFFAVIPAGIAFAGVAWVNVALATLRQRLTPRPLLGRVIAASRTLAWAGLPLGAALGGVLAGTVGVLPVYFWGSTLVLVVAGLLTLTPLYRDRVMADPKAHRDDAVSDGPDR